MAKNAQIRRLFGDKLDGVIEAVRFTSGGKIEWVRAYERRGPTWGDHVLLDRDTLVARLEAGKRFYAGKRITNHASEFELGERIQLSGTAVVTEGSEAKKDQLAGVPLL